MSMECLACGLCTGQVAKPSTPALKLSVIILTSCETVTPVSQSSGLFQSRQAHFKTTWLALKPSDSFKMVQVLSWSLIYIYIYKYMYVHVYGTVCNYMNTQDAQKQRKTKQHNTTQTLRQLLRKRAAPQVEFEPLHMYMYMYVQYIYMEIHSLWIVH